MKKKYFITFIFLSFLTACSEEDVCNQKVNTLLVANFYTLTDGAVEDTSLRDLTVLGDGTEELLYDSASSINHIELPLNYSAEYSSFIFKTNFKTDTIVLKYKSDLIFVSYACGFAPIYELTEIESSYYSFDSLIIVKKQLDPENEENIEIYF